ncbi:MAG: S1 RNA-binding domain-containing protein [Planctomycetaceae bacterium]|nr:S1 RNA-binding domain-containing protein [Planctomycetaceae bacterium]
MSTEPVPVPSESVDPSAAVTPPTDAVESAGAEATPDTASTAATPVSDSAADAAAGDPPPADAVAAPDSATEAQSAESDSAADDNAPKRKLRLNPTFVPQTPRPIPNLAPGQVMAAEELPEESAAATPDAPPATDSEAVPPVEAEQTAPVPTTAPEPRVARPAPVAIPRTEELDADTEAELAAVMGSGEISEPAVAVPSEEGEAPVTEEALESGAKLKGTIQSIDAENVFVDLGLRMTGLIPLRQFDPKKPPEAGQAVNVTVDKVDEAEGLILCNLPKGRGRVSGDWSAVVVGQTVECRVSGVNKGGLEVSVGSLRGFMPASQVDLGFVANLDGFVGQQISARVTEVNPARRRLILSRRQIVAEERDEVAGRMLDEVQPGQVRNGVVRSLKDFGAFVDLGGIDGFLHVSQITWQRINKPSDVLSEGQPVEVKVLSVDRDKKRISLSLRQMQQNPWGQAEANYGKGTNVTGKVSRIEPFGAFIELEPGLEGLVHISELDHKHVKRVEDVLSLGQMIELQVLEVDPKKKRVSLSAKALKARPEAPPKPQDEDLAPGKGQVYERKNKGNLKGGIGGSSKGGLFGDPRQYN